MANDYAPHYAGAYVPPRAVEQNLFPALAFLALLFLVFVGLSPFSPPPLVPLAAATVSHGDAVRQIGYLGVAGLIGIAAIQRFGIGALRAVPVSMSLLLGWCLASAWWAPQPDLVLRRAGLEVVLVLSVALSVETLGTTRAFLLWRWFLAAVLLVNFLSIPLVAVARHGVGEIDPGLIGNWRGLYGHKNIAGAACALTAILFLFTQNGWRNWIGIAIAAAACFFLAMTHSRSSAGFLSLALLAGLLYRVSWRDGLSRAIFVAAGTVAVLMLAALALLNAGEIARLLDDPNEFTGRAAIWTAQWRYIANHPFLGAGFGTLTETYNLSPLRNYVTSAWVASVSHGHNGYLEILVTIGGVGFLLAMLALLVAPARRLWTLDLQDDGFRPMLFSLFVFALLHNLMESDFLEGDSIVWGALLLVIAALNVRRPSLTARLRAFS
ncbi:MAG TPA: O-antigen ligase family protein [Rhizomicrobium sp.]|nr:O-antigen ligase family protein [Rhizomicrobium sp.]